MKNQNTGGIINWQGKHQTPIPKRFSGNPFIECPGQGAAVVTFKSSSHSNPKHVLIASKEDAAISARLNNFNLSNN